MVNKENRPLTERWCGKYGKFKEENSGSWYGMEMGFFHSKRLTIYPRDILKVHKILMKSLSGSQEKSEAKPKIQ